MAIFKEIRDKQLYLYINGKLVYKRWLEHGYSKVFDVTAYDKYTLASIKELKYERHNKLIVVKADLTLKSTEDGGRQTGFISGFRPQHIFENDENQPLQTFIGDISFEGQSTIEPGEQKNVTVRFLFEQKIESKLKIGVKWWIREAGVIIGEAEITEIV